MTKRIALLSGSLFFLLLTMGAFTGMAAEEFTYTGPPITIRFSSYYAPSYCAYKFGVEPWIKTIEQETKGKIQFKIYLNAVLHSSKDGFKAMVSDIADITPAFPAYQAGSFHLCHGADLPFAFPNSYVASLVVEELYPKYLKKEYENLGVYLGYYPITSTYHIFTKNPIHKFEDFKGIKIRSPGGSSTEVLKKLGISPAMITSSELYTSLQRGIIDGILFHQNGHLSFRTHEIAKYGTILGICQVGIPNAMNKKFFDGLPKEVKGYLYKKLRILAFEAAYAFEKDDLIAREEMVKQGTKLSTLSPEDLKKSREAVEPVWDEFIANNEKLGLPAKQFVKDLRALSAKYSTWTPEQVLKKIKEEPVKGIIDF